MIFGDISCQFNFQFPVSTRFVKEKKICLKKNKTRINETAGKLILFVLSKRLFVLSISPDHYLLFSASNIGSREVQIPILFCNFPVCFIGSFLKFLNSVKFLNRDKTYSTEISF